MAQVRVADLKWLEDFCQARLIAPGGVSAVRNAADVDDVADVVVLEECQEPHKIKVAVANRKDRWRHTSLYTIRDQ